MKNVGLLVCIAVLCQNCTGLQQHQLTGRWKASDITEDGMPLDVDISTLGFVFSNDGFYEYHGTLNYKEAGSFSVRGDLLYTLDTINQASSEKAVKILNLTNDSLFLKMNEEGKIRIVKLFKVN
ncbi:MAG: hypothetical protein R2830_13220 [Saprospiraceae bacterium]